MPSSMDTLQSRYVTEQMSRTSPCLLDVGAEGTVDATVLHPRHRSPPR